MLRAAIGTNEQQQTVGEREGGQEDSFGGDQKLNLDKTVFIVERRFST